RVLQTIVGMLTLTFGGIALAISGFVAIRPLLMLYPDRVLDVRRKLEIPFSAVSSLEADNSRGFFSVQWLKLTLRNPREIGRHALLTEQLRDNTQLTLDLSLASESDFRKAQEFIGSRLGQTSLERRVL
ncbi:MAG: hypothetical protein ACPL7K_08795, partial [Armatimonadota bacterium]